MVLRRRLVILLCAALLIVLFAAIAQPAQSQLGGNLWRDKIAAGSGHTCFITRGLVRCWGDEHTLGQPFTSACPLMDCGVAIAPAKPVRGVSNALSLAAGDGFTCALVSGGTVKCWGTNIWGELGINTGLAQRQGVVRKAVPIAGVQGAISITASGGNKTWCAILRDGSMKCMGFNQAGELGGGSDIPRASHVPVTVKGLPGPAIDAANAGAATCAAISDGTVWCWGDNMYGEIGIPAVTAGPGSEVHTPTQVQGLPPSVVDLAAGNFHVCARTSSGAVYCWGQNTFGQFGDGTHRSHHTPRLVLGMSSGARHIWAGLFGTCALMKSGAVRCWGQGPNGDGTKRGSPRPVTVRGLPAHINGVSMGIEHACARSTSGAIYCWGGNNAPEGNPVGDGSAKQRLLPVRVF